MNSRRILLVEDDPDSQEVFNRILRHYGMSVDTVNQADKAIDLLENSSYSLAIVDLALPGSDGWQLLQAIRRVPYGEILPCIAVTAYDSVEVGYEALNAGFAAYFPKPIDPANFMKTLEGIITDSEH